MKKLLLISACVAALGMSQVANALEITPATFPQWTGTQTSQSQIDTAIASVIGSATELYKHNVEGADLETGALAGSYSTVFARTATDPQDATVTYTGGDIVGPPAPAYALVKDGLQNPAWYLFDLRALGWNGMETLYFTDFWPGSGAISHVSLYGTRTTPPGTGVPDGGATAALLGLGMLGLGFMARRKA